VRRTADARAYPEVQRKALRREGRVQVGRECDDVAREVHLALPSWAQKFIA
jgi:hypothetical protein